MSRHPYQVVLSRVRAYIAADGQGEQGEYELWRIRADTALQLGDIPGYARDEQALSAQVRQALDTIVREGTLIKVRRDEYGPDGCRDGLAPRYYTPAAFERARTAHTAQQEAASVRRGRWEKVNDDLCTAGFPVLTPRGEPVHLSLDTWEQVAALLQPHLEARI